MKDGKRVILNGKGILLICTMILALTFTLGYVSGRAGDDVTTFTSDDLERIVELKNVEERENPDADIYAYKDKRGNLLLGWD